VPTTQTWPPPGQSKFASSLVFFDRAMVILREIEGGKRQAQ
jgi:hypothetical protein